MGTGAELRTVGGIRFLRLVGDSVERARQHGAFARASIDESALPALAGKNPKLLKQAVPAAALPIVRAFYSLLVRKMARRVSRDERRIADAFCEAAGIERDVYFRALSQPDIMMLMVRASLMRWLAGELPPMALPGCTSGVALGRHTRSRKILACRNLDYPIVGPWEKNTAVLFHEPMGSGEIPHVTVSSFGFHASGMSSMNREGLTLSIHAHYGKDVSINGKLITTIADEIIARARTIDEAISIVKKRPRIGNWAFVIASALDGDAAVIEMTHDQIGVRRASESDGILSHTNYFEDAKLRSREAFLSTVVNEDLCGRCVRMADALRAKSGSLELEDLAAALGSTVDAYTGKASVAGHTTAAVTTVGSMVFSPEEQVLAVSSRSEAPTSLGPYVRLDARWSSVDSEFSVPQPQESLVASMREYRAAYQAWHMDFESPDNPVRTLSGLEAAIALYPQDPTLRLNRGFVLMRAGRSADALSAFEGVSRADLSPGSQEVLDLMLARGYDLAQDRDRALQIYRRIVKSSDPRLAQAARKGLRRPYRASQARSLLLDLQFPDALTY